MLEAGAPSVTRTRSPAATRGAFAYLPSRKVAIAVVTTFVPEALAGEGAPKNSADLLWRRIAAALVPAEAPQTLPSLQ